MIESPERNDLLDDIERRQNDILRELDDLNLRIEGVLNDLTGGSATANPTPGA